MKCEGISRISCLRGSILFLACCLLLFGCGTKKSRQIEEQKEAGIAAMESGDYKKALENFDGALQLCGGKVDESVVDICFYKAAAQFQLGEVKEAIATYTALMSYDEEMAEAAFLRGSIYLKEGELEKALADYHTALKRREDNYEMYLLIGENLTASGYEKEGRGILELGLDVEGDDGANNLGRGRIYLALGENDKAVSELKKAVEKEEKEASVYLAQAYFRLGEDKKASALLEDYIKEDNPSGEALAMLGNMEMAQNNYQEALLLYRQGLEKKGVSNEKELRKGEIAALEYMGDFAEAKERLKEYLKLYPQEEEAKKEEIFLETR